jgi:uncharacterized RDD family membrane protein YckC
MGIVSHASIDKQSKRRTPFMITFKKSNYNGTESQRMQELHGLPLASFKSRAGAFYVDFLIAAFVCTPILMFGAKLLRDFGLVKGDLHLVFDYEHWYSIIPLVVYFSLSIYFGNGKTLGKRLMGIRVVSVVHEKISFWHAVERALGYGASFLEFGFGFLQYFIDSNRRTVHDRIAETIVIEDRKRKVINMNSGEVHSTR